MFLMPSEGGPPELYERPAQARSSVRTYLADALLARARAVPDKDLTVRMIHAASDEIVRLRLSEPDITPSTDCSRRSTGWNRCFPDATSAGKRDT